MSSPFPDSARRWVGLRAASAVLGAAAVAWGGWALWVIPRGPREFFYVGQRLWPLPFANLNGFTPEQLSSHLARLGPLGLGVLLLSLAVGRRGALRLPLPSPRTTALVTSLVVVAVSVFVLRGTPLQDDETTYLYQAQQLAEGRLADPAFGPDQAFHEPFTIFTPSGATGKYLFGMPAVLVPGLWLGVPLLGVLAFAAAGVLALGKATARACPEAPGLAAGAALLLGLSPMYVTTAATLVSQTPALALCALGAWALTARRSGSDALAGLAFGLAFTMRPQLALPAGGALVLAMTGLRPRALAAVAVGAAPALAAVLLYDRALTGDALALPWSQYHPLEGYGFGAVLEGGRYLHTPLKGLALAGVALLRLDGWALGWPLSLAGPVAWFALGRPHRAAVAPWAWAALATFLFHVGYYCAGVSETGAVYHHAVLPFIALATASSTQVLLGGAWGQAVGAFLALSSVLGTGTFYLEHLDRLARLARAIDGPRAGLEAAAEGPLLIVEDPVLPRPGWVFGGPRRERRHSAPVVYYPREALPGLGAQASLLAGRECVFLWYDWGQDRYRTDACASIGQHDEANRRAFRALGWRHPQLTGDGRPWLEGDGWKDAFPWVPSP